MKMDLVPRIFYDSLIMSECPISEKLSNGSTLNHSGSPHWQKQLYCICLQSWSMFYGLFAKFSHYNSWFNANYHKWENSCWSRINSLYYQQKSMRMYLPLVKSTPQVTKKINMHLSELIKMAKEQLEVWLSDERFKLSLGYFANRIPHSSTPARLTRYNSIAIVVFVLRCIKSYLSPLLVHLIVLHTYMNLYSELGSSSASSLYLILIMDRLLGCRPI